MRQRSYGLSLAVPLRPWLQGALFAALLATSLLLIYAERQHKDWVNALRLSLLDLSAPLAQAIASPARAIEDLAQGWHNHWQVIAENRQLRYDNAQLLEWKTAAMQLQAENEALRRLMHYQPHAPSRFITAKAIAAAGGSLSNRLHINAGLEDGLRRHLPVANAHGMIGRILHVSPGHAEVLLLTDISSRIPVTLQPSGIRAILIGDHTELPYLKLANPKQQPPLGEMVMTSDDGGLLPAGMHVGKLFAARDGRYEVLPAFRDHRIDYVRVIDRR